MKPIQLVMRAFGPYPKAQVIDFRELGDRSLFLIHGPTGAGKTSVLDAVCFALYGESSGAERKADELRSHLAAPEVTTEVVFDFELGNKRYRVWRSPTQDLPKMRGEGFTTRTHKATLWDRSGLADDDEEGQVLATRASEVTQELTERLGFTADQFRQVVVLPQGQFRRLLSANSTDRQAILQTIFQSEVYRRVEEALKEKAKNMEGEMRGLRETREALLHQAEVQEPGELEKKRKDKGKQLKEAGKKRKAAAAQQKVANKALQEGQKAEARFKELEEAQEELDKITKLEPEQTKRKEELRLARAAERLEEPSKNLAARKAEDEEARSELEKAQVAAAQAENNSKEAQAWLKEERGKEPEREQARMEVDRLQRLSGVVEEVAALRKKLVLGQKKAKESAKARDKAKGVLTSIKEGIEDGERKQGDLRNKAGRLEELKLRHADLERSLTRRKELEAKVLELESGQKDHAKKQAARIAAQKKVEQQKKRLSELQASWTQGQAAILAQVLKEGQPCPVCGSLEHPYPAVSQEALPGQPEIEASQELLVSLEEGLEEVRDAESKLANEVAGLEATVSSLRQNLEERADIPIETLEAELKLVGVEKQDAAKAAAELDQLEKQLQALSKQRGETETQLEELALEAQQAEKDAGSLQALVVDKEKEVPEDLRADGAMQKALVKATKLREDLIKAYEKGQSEAQESSNKQASAAASLKAAQKHATETQKKYKLQEKAFGEALEKAGFKSIDEYEEVRSLVAQIDQIEAAIQRHDQAREAASARLLRAQKASKGLERPNLPALERATDQTGLLLQKAVEEQTRYEDELTQLDKLWDKWSQLEERLQKLQDLYSVTGQLSKTASGQNRLNLTFERFVLGTLLDEVLEVASQRLGIMSRGRFRLQRSHEVADRRSAAGLDLEVLDAYSGTERPVATLSGGEGFMASLALALGLADVVQSHAGGRRLNTIFVDEGFGSLDSDSLDQALECLLELQQGGRLVGVISHVSDLKERIPARLLVETSPSGSRARFEC